MSSRRDFIKQSSLFTAGLYLSPEDLFKGKTPVGIQLYTLRNDIAKDAKGTIGKVAALGYKEIETFGYKDGKYFDMPANEFAQFLKTVGLTSPSGHYFGGGFFLKDKWEEKWLPLLNDAKTIGQQYVVVPYLEEENRKSETYKLLTQKLNKAGEMAKAAGLQLAYHNHDFEFKDLGGQTGFNMLLKETDSTLVKMELDIYWAVKAGYNPVDLFKANPGRYVMWHVKDMDNTEKKYFTEVGNGTINFKNIFANAKLSGMKHFFVEQDVCPGPPLESASKSITYIQKNLVK
ncbi:MAG: sugar phosphate isomerase/epimerase [Chitinophagaceae bacterium]|nr:sugar phosphate isomerase/epimerase [Chitinophagaceae bacterium]